MKEGVSLFSLHKGRLCKPPHSTAEVCGCIEGLAETIHCRRRRNMWRKKRKKVAEGKLRSRRIRRWLRGGVGMSGEGGGE